MIELSDDRARVRHDLASVIESCESSVNADGTVSIRGTQRFAPSLVGPPGRLHGGLHAFARVVPVLGAIREHVDAPTFPCRLTLGLYRPLPLDESVAFHGTYERSGDRFALSIDHGEPGKLHATATSYAGDSKEDSQLAWFREAYLASRDETPEKEIRAQGDIPMQVLREIVVMPVSVAMRKTDSPTFARFVNEDGTLEASAACVGLDLLGAVTQGYAWQARIFTTRIDLVLEAAAIDADVPLLMLASRASEGDPECHVRPVPVRDGMGGPMKVRVLLTDAGFTRALAHGTFTLVPAKRD